jgi:hypothetical protein
MPLSAIGFLESGSVADLRPLRPDQRAAAFVSGAAAVGTETQLGAVYGLAARCCRLLMTAGSSFRWGGSLGQWRTNTMFVHGGRHRDGVGYWSKRPPKQDQQQQLGRQSMHRFQGRRRGFFAYRQSPHAILPSKCRNKPQGPAADLKDRVVPAPAQPPAQGISRGLDAAS